MANYDLSVRAQFDMVGIYKFGIKYFGIDQAVKYQYELEEMFNELAERPALSREAFSISSRLLFYRYKSHYIFYQFENETEILVLRVLGKRMNFIEHLEHV